MRSSKTDRRRRRGGESAEGLLVGELMGRGPGPKAAAGRPVDEDGYPVYGVIGPRPKGAKPKALPPARKRAILKAALKRHQDEMWERHRRREGLTRDLLRNIKAKMPTLEKELAQCSSHFGYEDPVYRLYHGSLKVFYLQGSTKDIVDLLGSLAPDAKPLNEDFLRIFKEGTAAGEFKAEYNRDWHRHARPVVEAFFHARFMLEMAVRYGKELGEPPQMLPSGWAALLYLYGLR